MITGPFSAILEALCEEPFKGKLGSGERFDACVKSVKERPGFEPKGGRTPDESAKAICAFIGRKKYGKAGFAKLGAKGK